MRKIYFVFLLLLMGCLSPTKNNSKPVVLVTIPPYAYFVKAIAGDAVVTEIFVPAGANPHTYEPTPQQVQQLASASLWFRLGDSSEEKILPFLRQKGVQEVMLTEGLNLLGHEEHAHLSHEGHPHEGNDLHIWLDPVLAINQIQSITDHLSALIPVHREEFKKNCEQFTELLQQLNEETTGLLTPFQNSYLLLSHPALGYYCARYGLHQLSVECEGKDPLPQQVSHIVQEAIDHDVKVIFTQPQHNNKGATLIAEKLEIPLHEIDPYAEEYFDTIRHITQLITQHYDD